MAHAWPSVLPKLTGTTRISKRAPICAFMTPTNSNFFTPYG
jgi:hypothetical protein